MATSRDLQVFVDRSASQQKWSSTRTPCGCKTSNGHRCGRATGHGAGGHVCRCVAERALESMGVYVGRVAA